MELLFKNTTKLSKDIYNDFLIFHSKTYDLSYFLYTIGILLLLLFCMAAQISSQNYFLLALFIVIFLAFLFWRLYHPVRTVKKEYESKKINKQQKITYLFFPRYFEIQLQGDFCQVYYHNLYRVFETNDFFYLYIDKTHAFLVNKDSFSIR